MTGPNIGLVLDPDLQLLIPGARDLLALWQAGRGDDQVLPLRGAFDPLALRRFLGNLLIVDIERASPQNPATAATTRLRYRLIGTEVAQMSGRDMTKQYFDEIYDPAALGEMRYCFGWVADRHQPARVFGTFRHANRAFLGFEALFLPVATDDPGLATQVIAYVIPTRT